MKGSTLIRKILLAITLLTVFLATHATEPVTWLQDNMTSQRSTMVGLGYHNGLDTYLSPEEYSGIELRIIRENMRMTHLMKGKVSVQNLFQIQFNEGNTPADEATAIGGMVNWDLAWHYNWQIRPDLKLMAGPMMQTRLGFVYNTGNGNNPAQGRLAADMGISGMAIWKLSLRHRTVTLRAQADIPLFGLCFSPNYGQSYYEIFTLGNYDHNVCFTHTFQAVSFRGLITADIPIKKNSLRLGYLCDIRQNKVNNLKLHDWSHTFLLGYVKRFQLIPQTTCKP